MTLTSCFELVVDGNAVSLPHSAERVLAFLALSMCPVHRARVASMLWIDVPEPRAANNLRTALWRLNRAPTRVVTVTDNRLRLSADLTVDTVVFADLARRMLSDPTPDVLAQVPMLIELGELLPDWDDGWMVPDRERLALLRLEALERAAATLLDRGQLADALLAASAAVRLRPARDSARRLVVRVHLARGNTAEAIASFVEYRDLLRAEFGVEPSPAMQRLLEPFQPALPVR